MYTINFKGEQNLWLSELDFAALSNITEAELDKIGVKLGSQRKILAYYYKKPAQVMFAPTNIHLK